MPSAPSLINSQIDDMESGISAFVAEVPSGALLSQGPLLAAAVPDVANDPNEMNEAVSAFTHPSNRNPHADQTKVR